MIDYKGLIQKYGYPLYIYDEREIESALKKLRNGMVDFEVFYSVKANPNGDILEFFSKNGTGADCASANEVEKARSLGFLAKDILYSAPGKTNEEILDSIGKCTIIADSLSELSRINSIVEEKTKIGVRINPSVGFSKGKAFEIMGGDSSKFGIDEELFFDNYEEINQLENIDVVGIHVYMGSGILDHDIILENFKKIFDIANRFDRKFEFIDFGGGFGIDYSNKTLLDIDKLGKGVKKLVDEYNMESTRLIIESGRYLVAKSGVYLTKITDVKESMGKTYYIVYGGMNGFFRPTFTKELHKVEVLNDSKEMLEVVVAGHLCTPIDVIDSKCMVKKAQVMDDIMVKDAGAYGYTMSILEFISHRKPIEIYIDKGQYRAYEGEIESIINEN